MSVFDILSTELLTKTKSAIKKAEIKNEGNVYMNQKSSKKRSMYRQTKRFLAGFLAVLLTVCMLPVDLFGASDIVYATEESETAVLQEEKGEAAVTDDQDAEEGGEVVPEIETGTTEPDSAEADLAETDVEEDEGIETDVEETNALSDEETDVVELSDTEVPETDESTELMEIVIDEIKKEVRAEGDEQQGTVHKLDGAVLTKKDHSATVALDDYFTLVCNSGKKIKINTASSQNANVPDFDTSTYVIGITAGGLGQNSTTPFVGIDNDTNVYGPSVAFKSASKKTKVVVKFSPKADGKYIQAATATAKLKDITYSIDGVEGTATKTYGAVYTETFTLVGEANTNYYVGFDGTGGVIMSIEVTELPDLPAVNLSTSTVKLSMNDVDGWNADDSSTWKAPYTGSKVTPAANITVGDNAVAANNYKLLYARKTGDAEPAEADYKEASSADVDLSSLGTIYVKAVATAGNIDYEGETTPVTFEIVKGIAPTVDTRTYVADISKATDEEKNNDSISQTIDLNDVFTFESKYGLVTFKNARVEDGAAANNVLAATPDVQLSDSSLSFNTKANAPANEQVKATIKVDAEFENYETATLALEITLAEKKTVTIEGITIEKTYDGTAVEPSVTNLTIKEGTQEITDETLKSSLVYTYAAKDGEALDEAPKDAGAYTLTVSVPLDNASYTGESDAIAFTIEKAALKITAKDRKWVIGYAAPAAKAPGGGEDNPWYKAEGLAEGETLKLLEAEASFTYQTGETPVTDWTAIKETDIITIVPALEREGGFNNYEVTAVNGKLTVEKEPELKENEKELNLTKNWHIGTLNGASALLYNGNGSENDPNKDTQSDGYFTVKGDVKTAGENNAYPLVIWGNYENAIKVNSKTDIQFTAPEGSALEFIAHIQNNKAGAINVDGANAVSITLNGQPTGAEGVTVTKLGDGTIVPPYKDTAPTNNSAVYKVTMTLTGTTDNKHILKNGSGEHQLYYIKVTEPGADQEYTVTFKNGADTFKTETVTAGQSLSLADIKPTEQAGKVFKGWAAKADAAAADVITSITPTADTTLYAVWVNVYTVTLKNGDSVVGTPATVEEGEPYDLPKLGDTETDYFLGWKNADAGDTNLYKVNIIPTKDTTLVAYFVSKETSKFYIVTVDFGYKENETDPENKKETFRKLYTEDGEEVTVALSELGTPERDGYTFNKWMAGDAEVPADGLKIKADVTITATWTKNASVAEKYTVAFTDKAGNQVPTTDVLDKAGNKVTLAEVEKDTIIILPDTTEKKEGCIWSWATADNKTYKAGDEYTVTQNVTFTGDWTENGGDIPTPPTVKTIKLEDCAIAVPSIIADAKKNPKNESKTSVVYYADKDQDGNPVNPVRFAEGLDFTVEYSLKADNVYRATIKGAGRTVDQYEIDPASTIVKEYKVFDKKDKSVIDLNKAKITLDSSAKTAIYTGYGITPAVTSVKVGKIEIPSTKYKVSYKSNVNAGKASVIISADSDAEYKEGENFVIGSKTMTFTIKKAAINKANQITVTAKDKDGKDIKGNTYEYRGTETIEAQELTVVSAGGRTLKEDVDYTVTYKNNRKAGKASIVLKGIGNNVSGSLTIPFTINPLVVDPENDKFAPYYGFEYTPNGAKAQYIVLGRYKNGELVDTIMLEEGVDFKGSYKYASKNKEAGSTVTFSGKGINAFKGGFKENDYTIKPSSFDGGTYLASAITVDVTKADLEGAALQKALEKAVVLNDYFGTKLKVKKDYVIEPKVVEGRDAVIIRPSDATKANYIEENPSLGYYYNKSKNIAKLKDVSFAKNYTLYYDGRNPVELGAKEISEIGGYKFVLGKDVEIVEGSYKNNYKAGNASVTIRGINGSGYYGTKVLKFKIVEK